MMQIKEMNYVNKDEQVFLNTLFDELDYSCFTESPYGTKVTYSPKKEDIFFCINALHSTKDLKPTADYHNEYLPRRADHNVVCFRNFLIELDNMSLDEQVKYVTEKLPVSTIVYSGGKSMHFIVSLETPLKDINEYRNVFARIQALLPKIDRACKNPSRLSRLPARIRPDTGKLQSLYYCGPRIKFEELDKLLPKIEQRTYSSSVSKSKKYLSVEVLTAINNPDEVIETKNLGGRNMLFFWLYNRFNELNLDPNFRHQYVVTAYENLTNKNGFSIEEALAAARLK